jgi:hypothetical protein
MRHLKSAKVYIFFAVLLFVAKPFVGYSIFNHSHLSLSVKGSILVKSFTKRKLESFENISSRIGIAQQKLADPLKEFIFLLCIGFSTALIGRITITNRFLRRLQLSLTPSEDTYILNGKLII